MDNIVRQLCKDNELVEIYTNPDDYDKFGVGYIEACTETDCLVHTFQENDLDDGYYVKQNDDILMIRKDTTYLKNMLHFIKAKAPKYELPKGYWPELNLQSVVLNLCMQEVLIAEVRLECGVEMFGWVREIGDNIVEIEQVDSDGMPDGITYVRQEDITMVGFGGLEEKRRTKLFAARR